MRADQFVNVRQLLRDCTERHRDRTAFIIKKEGRYNNISFSDLRTDIDALGTYMLSAGMQGQRIAVIGPNSYEWLLTYLTVVCGAGVIVPLDNGLPEGELLTCLISSEADCIVSDRAHQSVLEDMLLSGKCNLQRIIYMDELAAHIEEGKRRLRYGDRAYIDAPIDNMAMRALIFTSGTTSRSKAVMLSDINIASNICALVMHEDIRKDDIDLALLPYHHTFGLMGQMVFLYQGAATAFCDGIRHIQKDFREYGVTAFFCVPLIIESLHKNILKKAQSSGKLEKMRKMQDLSRSLMKLGIDMRRIIFRDVIEGLGGQLRLLISGAAAVKPEVISDFHDWGIMAIQGYGMTESSPVIAAENPENLRPGSVGKPIPNVNVMINAPDSEGIGEILVHGSNVMLGYYREPELTAETIENGWLHTGDYGKIDRDGFLYVTGRKKNVVVLKNGKNVYPEEIEASINDLPYVAESLVFGAGSVESNDEDSIVAAEIVIESGLDINEKTIWDDIKRINSKMPKYKHVKALSITKEPMIRTATAKVRRQLEIEKVKLSNTLKRIR